MAVSAANTRRGIFLDKDGTLLQDVPYNVDPEKMVLARGAGEALRRFAEEGYYLFVISNQSGVARGYFPPTALRIVRWRLEGLLAPFDIELEGFYACPHHPDGVVALYARSCECRKPKPGLLLRAAASHRIDLEESWMIGDILDDVEAGCRAGTRTVLLDGPEVGGETEWLPGPGRTPTFTASNLEEAADLILTSPTERKEGRCDAIYSN